MPATFASRADPALTVTITYVGRPSHARVEDRRVRRWDNSARPEVHRGVTQYDRWTLSLMFPAAYMGEAEALDDLLRDLYGMADASIDLQVSAPVGSSRPPWTGVVELTNPEVVHDYAAQPTADTITLELVEVA